MPTLNSRAPKYARHRQSGQARVCLDGRQILLPGPYGSAVSKAEYDRLVGEWLAGGRHLPTSNDLTVAEVILRYWTHCKGYYVKDGQPTPEQEKIRHTLKPVRRLYGATLARDFGPLALKTVRQQWVDGDLVRREINQRVGRVVRCFKWAVENELVPPNVLQALKAVAGLHKGRSSARESKPVRPVADAAVDAIRPFVSPTIWAMVELQRLTGARSSEVTIMRTGDIDRSTDVWVYTPASHKTEHHDKTRLIYLGPKAQEVLRPWLKADPDAYLFSPSEARTERYERLRANRKTPVQPSQRNRKKAKPKRAPGPAYDARSYNHAIRRGCIKAGIAPWHPHQLRHSAATHVRREFGVDVARVLLGHSSPVVTEIYAELDHAKAVEAVRKIG